MWTRLFDHALSRGLFERLSRAVIEHPRIEALSEHSFWFPLAASPRLWVEHAIGMLRDLLPTTDGLAGAEWWVPAMTSTQGMEWHCDCDRVVYRRDKRFVRPRISSVLYLAAVGGPTLVVDDVVNDGQVRRPRFDRGCLGFLPMPNRYSVFPGDRLHAVAISDEDALRVTLAINWWAAKPSAPLCIDPSYGAAALEPLAAVGEPAIAHDGKAVSAAPIELAPDAIAALPHRGFCPIYPRPRAGS